jgi:hypothetical protein
MVGGEVVVRPDVEGATQNDPLQAVQGDLVNWNNRTDQCHHPVAVDPAGLFLTDEIPPGRSSDPLFNVTQTPGTTITYMCSRHPDNAKERGRITVVPLSGAGGADV